MGAPDWVDVFPIENGGFLQPAMWSWNPGRVFEKCCYVWRTSRWIGVFQIQELHPRHPNHHMENIFLEGNHMVGQLLTPETYEKYSRPQQLCQVRFLAQNSCTENVQLQLWTGPTSRVVHYWRWTWELFTNQIWPILSDFEKSCVSYKGVFLPER